MLTFDTERAGPGHLIHPAWAGAESVRHSSAAVANAGVWLLFRVLCLGVRAGLAPAALETFQRMASSTGPVIFYAWHRYTWLSYVALRSLPKDLRPVTIAHDGTASRVTQRAVAWDGHDVLVFRRRGGVAPKEQISAFLRQTRRSILLFPDSGGPYGTLKPGMVAMARATDAWLVPFRVKAKGVWTLGAQLHHRVPMPFCTLEVETGPVTAGRSATVESCQRALDALERQTLS